MNGHFNESSGGTGIYINGMKVADESNFLFNYNITALNASIKKSLNRERQNLGRSAYSQRIRSVLLAGQSEFVAQALADDLQKKQLWATLTMNFRGWMNAPEGAHPHVTPQSRMGVRGLAGVADYGVADEMGKITLETRRGPLLWT